MPVSTKARFDGGTDALKLTRRSASAAEGAPSPLSRGGGICSPCDESSAIPLIPRLALQIILGMIVEPAADDPIAHGARVLR